MKKYITLIRQISDISELLRECIDTPNEDVFSKHFENDYWGIINILKAADRRFDKKRLEILKKERRIKQLIK